MLLSFKLTHLSYLETKGEKIIAISEWICMVAVLTAFVAFQIIHFKIRSFKRSRGCNKSQVWVNIDKKLQPNRNLGEYLLGKKSQKTLNHEKALVEKFATLNGNGAQMNS